MLQFDLDKFLSDKPLAITMSGLEELRCHIQARLALADTDIKAALETLAADRAVPQAGRPRNGAASSTGVIRIRGTISHHAMGDLSSFLFGGATTEGISNDLDAMLADDSISKIVLDIDSPGGSTNGVTELANKIIASRGQKPIIAAVNSLAGSAAYWIAAACDQIFVTPSGSVGAIGVYGIHQDVSKALENEGVKVSIIKAGKFKADGHPSQPLDDETRARAQTRVDDLYDQFIRDVARGRGVPETSVRNGYGEGDVLTAKRAKTEGMVDGIMTLDQVVAKTFSLGAPANVATKAEDLPVLEGEPDESEEDTTDNAEGQARLGRMRLKAFQSRAAVGAA